MTKITMTFFSLCVLLELTTAAQAATFKVNSTADMQNAVPGNGICTLRAAITEANALAGADTITLPAGTYAQTLTTGGENFNVGGDFDITGDNIINGADDDATFREVNTAATERVIHFINATAVLNATITRSRI